MCGCNASVRNVKCSKCHPPRSTKDEFVDLSYPMAAKKGDNHVRAYAKEVLSLGLLLMEFVDGVREADGERIIRCWK